MPPSYCLCNQEWGGRFMVECDRCLRWYHGSCVGITQKQARVRVRRPWSTTMPPGPSRLADVCRPLHPVDSGLVGVHGVPSHRIEAVRYRGTDAFCPGLHRRRPFAPDANARRRLGDHSRAVCPPYRPRLPHSPRIQVLPAAHVGIAARVVHGRRSGVQAGHSTRREVCWWHPRHRRGLDSRYVAEHLPKLLLRGRRVPCHESEHGARW